MVFAKMKKILCTAAALAFLAAAGCSGFSAGINDNSAGINDNSIIAYVHGEPVSFGEYRQELAKNYTKVLTKAVTAGGVQGKTFWTTKLPGGIKPLEMLKAAAMESAVRRKTIQIWAREYGLAGDISWEVFLESFNKENTRRTTALNSGEPVYGPKQFSLNIYYNLELAEAEFAILQKLEAETVPDEAELVRLYREEYRQGTYHPGRTTMDYALIRLDAEDSYRNAQSLRQALVNGEEMEQAAKKFGAAWQRRGINLLRMPAMGGIPDTFKEAVLTLSTGEVSQVLTEGDFYWIYKCFEREEGKYLEFEETRQKIVLDFLRKEYEKQLEARVKNAPEINRQLYAKINTKMILQNNGG